MTPRDGEEGWAPAVAARPLPAEPALLPRRLAMAAAAAGVALGLLALAWQVLAAGGWSGWEAAIFVCLVLFAPWAGLSAATALAGLLIRLAVRDPAALLLPASRAAPGAPPPTVLAVCIRLEEIGAVLRPAAALLAELRAGPGGGAFHLAILSDTPPGPEAEAEAAAAAALAAGHPPGVVLYRRRAQNTGWKAGNVMEFLDATAGRFAFCLLLDADSRMSARAVRRLVAAMAADPKLAILQPTIAGRGAETWLARELGFGQRHATRLWATGQAWWQGPQGPFWGHNALIRIAPFRAHARLAPLPDGRHILSHDHVEAARLHAAGFAVRVWPDDLGSAERHPPDLPAMFARDLRWAAGNLQWRHLLRDRALSRIGRFQMLQAILHYLLAPVLFLPLPLAALNVATGGAEGTPRGALLALLALGWLALVAPRVLGHAEALWRAPRRARPATARRIGREMVLSQLLDPLAALERAVLLARIALGQGRGWAPQRRDARGVPWREAARRFGPHTLLGLALAGLFATGGAFALVLALPFLAGLVLAVPLCVLTSRPPGAGGRPGG